ncbi:8300_t:CDS:2 [Diversispora eburnea]|uniref:8300_t:CDS:1 n=1 Tax=Diversispora eburnea TaxID=1213867 RepID=A0A9N9B657_9GLOM|nr:8300_t:CDS:2 [Diversispora eburnea]
MPKCYKRTNTKSLVDQFSTINPNLQKPSEPYEDSIISSTTRSHTAASSLEGSLIIEMQDKVFTRQINEKYRSGIPGPSTFSQRLNPISPDPFIHRKNPPLTLKIIDSNGINGISKKGQFLESCSPEPTLIDYSNSSSSFTNVGKNEKNSSSSKIFDYLKEEKNEEVVSSGSGLSLPPQRRISKKKPKLSLKKLETDKDIINNDVKSHKDISKNEEIITKEKLLEVGRLSLTPRSSLPLDMLNRQSVIERIDTPYSHSPWLCLTNRKHL